MCGDFRSDAEIIADSVAHPNEFGVIFERHHRSVFRFVARRLGRDEAGDAAAEVFIAAFRARKRFDRQRSNSLPWLYGIAYNIVGDRLRKAARSEPAFLAANLQQWALRDDGADVDERMAASDLVPALELAIAGLRNRDRKTFLLFALDGLTYSEIADLLRIPIGTVGSRISRSRRMIREAIPDLEQRLDMQGQIDMGDTNV